MNFGDLSEIGMPIRYMPRWAIAALLQKNRCGPEETVIKVSLKSLKPDNIQGILNAEILE